MPDTAVDLWNEIEAAEAEVAGSGDAAAINAVKRIRLQVRPGGTSAGDIHSIRRFRQLITEIVAGLSS